MKVEGHPQRQEIIDGILAGKSLRSIAATLTTPIDYTTIARFRRNLLGTATQRLKPRSEVGKALQERAAPTDGRQANDRLRDELQRSIQQLDKRRARWIDDAESHQEVNPVTGEVAHNMQHSALARHAGNYLNAIELRAKLGGLLDTGSSAVQLNVSIAANAVMDASPVIDVEATRK